MTSLFLLFILNPLKIAFGVYPNLKPSQFSLLFSILYFTTGVYFSFHISEHNIGPTVFAAILACVLRANLSPLILIAASIHLMLGAVLGINSGYSILAVSAIYFIRDLNETNE